jgi:hypothetical protein
MGASVVVFGALLARINYRAYRYATVPGPSTTLPIGLCAHLDCDRCGSALSILLLVEG